MMSPVRHVIEELKDVSFPDNTPVVLTIGTFDGVHMAHQQLMKEATERAAALGGMAVALTFRNHPRAIVSPENTPPLLTPWEVKRDLILGLGIDLVVGLQFSPDFARIAAEAFVREVISGCFHARVLISGPGFHFGRGAQGNAELLRAMSSELGYTYIRRDPVMFDGGKVSSTRIRGALATGDVELAAKLLTRPHANRGTVVTGDRIGRTIGFPTANLAIDPAMLVPADGVYAVRAHLENGALHPAMMNIGMRPTVNGREHRREVHLIDFDGELTGQLLWVEYIARLRDEEKFTGLDELKAQLAKDRDAAKKHLEGDTAVPPSTAPRRWEKRGNQSGSVLFTRRAVDC